MASNMTLITDGASHYCEKARWALERASVSYVETKHVVLLHMLFTRGLGVGTSCPKLVMGRSSKRVVLQESPEILRFADKNIESEEDRLCPDDPELRKLVRAWEWKFDKQLGPHVRRWSYCYLLFDQCSYKLLSQGVSSVERIFAWLFMPFVRRIVFRALYCNRAGAKERSLQVVEAIFKEVDELLADGRPYICGHRFTAADMTFAALGGPMVAPPQYGAWLPVIDDCPQDMASTMNGLRKSPAGRHILKIYDTKRHKSQKSQGIEINECRLCTICDDTKPHKHASQEIIKKGPNEVNMINEKIHDTKAHKPQEMAPGACGVNMINECRWCIEKGAYQANKVNECRWCPIA